MIIYLVRHGQTDYNKNGAFQGTTDVDLNNEGVWQANQTAARLKNKKIDAIYSSDYKRVSQTAEAISCRTGVPVRIKEELREINMGEWEALKPEQIAEKYDEYFMEWLKHDKDMAYPGGECGIDVQKRTMKVIEEILAAGYENTVIVTSGGNIRVLLCSFLGMKQESRFYFDTDNCGISIVRYEKETGRYHIKCTNDTSHMDTK